VFYLFKYIYISIYVDIIIWQKKKASGISPAVFLDLALDFFSWHLRTQLKLIELLIAEMNISLHFC